MKLSTNFEALEFARSLGLMVAINIIADPDWDETRFRAIREWALSVPEIVNISVNTPYPGTETFLTRGAAHDARLSAVRHPARRAADAAAARSLLRRARARRSRCSTRSTSACRALKETAIRGRLLLRGQTNFVKMLWRFNSVFNPERQLADHAQPVFHQMRVEPPAATADRNQLYILRPRVERAPQPL